MAKDRGEKGLDRREFLHLVGGAVGGIALGTLGASNAGAPGKITKNQFAPQPALSQETKFSHPYVR